MGRRRRGVDLEVDMRRANPSGRDGVGAGNDGANAPGAVFRGVEARIALEIGVEGLRVRVARVQVAALGVGLPDVDDGAAHGLALAVEHAADDFDHLALGAVAPARHLRQVPVVVVDGDGEEGAVDLVWGRHAGGGPRRRADRQRAGAGDRAAEQRAPRQAFAVLVHRASLRCGFRTSERTGYPADDESVNARACNGCGPALA